MPRRAGSGEGRRRDARSSCAWPTPESARAAVRAIGAALRARAALRGQPALRRRAGLAARRGAALLRAARAPTRRASSPSRDRASIVDGREVRRGDRDRRGATRTWRKRSCARSASRRRSATRSIARSTHWQAAEIVIDETPIGTFLEIEGAIAEAHATAPPRRWAISPDDYVADSYVGALLRPAAARATWSSQ